MHTFIRSCYLALPLLALAAPAHADTYPDKPIRMIVNFAAGGPLDAVARLIAEQATPLLKQTIIVENRAGAGGNIGAEYVARAPADGYTVLVSIDHLLTVNPLVYKKMSFDPSRDFVPAGVFGTTTMVLAAHPSLKLKNFQDFLNRAAKEDLPYASAGVASPGHLTFELLKARTKIKGTHVPYKGNAPALNDLVAGQVPLAFFASSNTIQYVRAGTLQALATSASTRNPLLPEVPTVQELGVPDFDVQFAQLVLFRTGTPEAIVQRWESLLKTLLATPAVKEKLEQMALNPAGANAKEAAALIQNTKEKWAAVVKQANIQLD